MAQGTSFQLNTKKKGSNTIAFPKPQDLQERTQENCYGPDNDSFANRAEQTGNKAGFKFELIYKVHGIQKMPVIWNFSQCHTETPAFLVQQKILP